MCCFDDRLSIIWPIFCLLAASSYGRHILVYLHTTSNSKRRKETTREIMHFLKLLRDCDPFCGWNPQQKHATFGQLAKFYFCAKLQFCFTTKKEVKPFTAIILMILHNVIKSKEFLRKSHFSFLMITKFHFCWWWPLVKHKMALDHLRSSRGIAHSKPNCEHHLAWFTMVECLLGFPPADKSQGIFTKHSFLIVFCAVM